MPHLTAVSLLGGTIPERETIGQLLAAQIGSLLIAKRPQETRTLVVGLGLQKATIPKEEFRELVGLALKGLV
jgi:proteasome assembly chaperone 3